MNINPAALSQLKNQGSDKMKMKKLEESAAQFESIFIAKILKEAMPEGEGGDSVLFGKSNAREIYKSMLYDAMAGDMAKAGGLGLKEIITKEYSELYSAISKPSKKELNIVDGDFRLSSEFGFRKDPFKGKTSFHYGVDLAAPSGTRVNTPVEGEVIFSGVMGGYGNCIKVKGNNNNTYVFGHLKSLSKSSGDRIKQGDKIGEVGSTGRSTGPHLHFEVRDQKGDAVNPLELFSFSGKKIEKHMAHGGK